jgi:hypothetical protein
MTDAEELAYYRQINQKAMSSPKAREILFALRKEVFPDAPIPEHDIPTQLKTEMDAELKRRDEEFEKYKHEQENKEWVADFKARREAATQRYRLTEADVKAVDAMVEDKDKNWPSWELAAEHYAAISEPIKPGGLGLLGLSQTKGALEQRKEFNDRYRKLFHKTGSKGREVLSEALDEVRSGEYLNKMR